MKTVIVSVAVVLAALILARAGLYGLEKYLEETRFVMVPGNQLFAFKLDRKTGQVWWIREGEESFVMKDPVDVTIEAGRPR